MNRRTLIGIDVGWSEASASCGIAVASGGLELPAAHEYGSGIRAGRLTLGRLLDLIGRWKDAAPGLLRDCVVVIDGPLGPRGPPKDDRHVDSACARGGFAGRCQPTPISHPSAVPFVKATYEILNALGMTSSVWVGGAFPQNGAVVVETNPTVALAVAIEQQPIAALPSRKRTIQVQGKRVIRAKSDWYWCIGARGAVWKSLSSVDSAEGDHERIAALTCLAIAAEFDAGRGVAIGNEDGLYGMLSEMDSSWRPDVARVGIVGPALPAWCTREAERTCVPTVIAIADGEGESAIRDEATLYSRSAVQSVVGDEVRLVLCDSGGVNERHNVWLSGRASPVALEVPRVGNVVLSHGPGRSRNPDQWVISPSCSRLRAALKATGAPVGHDFGSNLSGRNPLSISARISAMG